MNHFILMSDIVGSSEKNTKKLLTQFKSVVAEINSRRHKEIRSPLTITLGDEFQGIIANLSSSINIIFEIEELILSRGVDFKLRYVLNFGKVSSPINKKIAHEMMGEGLSAARKSLNELKHHDNRFLIILEKKKSKAALILNDLFTIYQYYIDSWKPRDHKLASEFLIQEDYKKIADELDLNRSTTWRREKSLHIEEYKKIKRAILNIVSVYDRL